MSRNSKTSNRISSSLVEVKSKFDAEFRRFSIEKHKLEKLDDFRELLEELHILHWKDFVLTYTDPKDGCLLPITNDDNFKKAIETTRPTLKIIIQRESYETAPNGSNNNKFQSMLSPFVTHTKNKLIISHPQDFRQVAAIIDVDVVPEVCRRVRLLKHGSDKPLGFYIRDGTSVRVTPAGLERVPGIYISRLVPGGLAESTGLLAVNDEVVEVNGIEVQGKTLDQVTDMMVANSSNLIITVKPANQRTLSSHGASSHRGSFSRNSAMSSGSHRSAANSDEDNFDQDEIRDLTQQSPPGGGGGGGLHSTASDEGILHL